MEGRFFLSHFGASAEAPRYPLRQGRQIIGRSLHAAVVIRDPSVSREHAAVEVRDGEVWLQDLGSKHGTFVNSRRITRKQLQVGDIVVIGVNAVLRVDLEAKRPSEPTAALPTIGRSEGKHTWNDKETDVHRWPAEPPTDASVTGLQATTTDISAEAEFVLEGSPITPLHPPNLEAAGRLCLDSLPGVYARLNMICDQLRSVATQPDGQVDAGRILRWIEPLLVKVTSLMTAMVQAPGRSPPLVMLGDVVEDALRRAAPALTGRSVAIERRVPHGLGLRVHPVPLAQALAALLVGASVNVASGSVISIDARSSDDDTELELSLPGRLLLSEVDGKPGAEILRRARVLLESQQAQLTMRPGSIQVVVRSWDGDEYSPA